MPPPRRRRRPSTIDKLDPEIRELIAKLRIDGGYSIDEILAQLRKMLAEEHLPSRSALGRHVKSIEEIGAELKKSREIASSLIGQLGEGPENRAAELNIEMLHTAVFQLMALSRRGDDGEPVTIDPDTVKSLAISVKALADARKVDADLKLRLRKEAATEAAKAVDAVAKDNPAGLTTETVDLIKRRIMGIAG